MRRITMLQEPGFLWDLYCAFYLHFNHEDVLKAHAYNRVYEDFSQHCKDVLNRFGEISEDLYLFFHPVGKDDVTFVSSYYLKEFEKDFKANYNVGALQRELADSNQVIQNMISFYFCTTDDDASNACADSKETVFEAIKKSSYSTEEKIKLYEFFINPIYYISLLQRTLIDQYSVLSGYYKEHYKEIIDAYDPTEIAKTKEKLLENGEKISDEREEYVSFCLLDRAHFEVIPQNEAYLYLLGIDYKQNKQMDKSKPKESALENLCFGLCEKNRINILHLLLERGEVTCKDLERYFDFSGSTAYHHLSIMNRRGIVCTRNEGKMIYYRINKELFDEVIVFLKEFKY